MAILALNVGSSSLKFALFDAAERRLLAGQCRGLAGSGRPCLEWRGAEAEGSRPLAGGDHQAALAAVLALVEEQDGLPRPAAVGHRVVHGGERFADPVVVDEGVLAALAALAPLAPLHQPPALAVIRAARRALPGTLQVACFDTAFHRTLPERERLYAIPRRYAARGVRRYGFHGLSLESVVEVLPFYLGGSADGRVVVAHLGRGVSLTALRGRRSLATTMGLTPLDGVPMATRPGSLDPGILLWWLREEGLSAAQIDRMLEEESGLRGLVGGSGDLGALLGESRPEAHFAVDYFVHHLARAVGSLAAALEGVDALVLTGGLAEHLPELRARLCRRLAWLGLHFDEAANRRGEARLSRPDSPVAALALPADEERVIARHASRLLAATAGKTKGGANCE
ncbi:MAG: acetate kinase [Porticoccaceae bacterium]|nr:MAG: acetate kinase [Porticoccaceae bacterium]